MSTCTVRQKKNGFEEFGSFNNDLARLDVFENDPVVLEVRNAADVLHKLCRRHDLITEDTSYDPDFLTLVSSRPVSREISSSARLIDGHHKGAADHVHEALDLWKHRRILTTSKIETGGRPALRIQLDLSTFHDEASVRSAWRQYFDVRLTELENKARRLVRDFYAKEIWIATVSFSTHHPSSLVFTEFKKGDVVPSEFCAQLHGFTTSFDVFPAQVERLGKRVLISVEHKCKCLRRETVQYAIDPAQINSIKGTVIKL